jgi:hypothetical protein
MNAYHFPLLHLHQDRNCHEWIKGQSIERLWWVTIHKDG